MSRRLNGHVGAAVAILLAVAALGRDANAQRVTELRLLPPRFTDPDRAKKLRGAFPAIDQMFRDYIAREHIPGAAWGVLIDGDAGALGRRRRARRRGQAPVEPDTVFRIASMTKSFTAMAILKLRDEGRLSLDDPAERYVPELKGLRIRRPIRRGSPSGIC